MATAYAAIGLSGQVADGGGGWQRSRESDALALWAVDDLILADTPAKLRAFSAEWFPLLERGLPTDGSAFDEMQKLADSSDDATREKGRRGLEILKNLQEAQLLTVDPSDDETTNDVDVKILRAARDCGGTVITTDTNLQKAAAVSAIRTLNVHELAEALRPAVTEGMRLKVRITKEGKEANQGVGHLADGTMVVVEDGKKLIGDEAEITVTNVRQTSAGRMVFARLA